MINIENLSLDYALKNIRCHIPQGKLVGIMGANGAGKSTLLKAMAGIIPIKQGQIFINHQPLHQLSAQQKSQQLAYLAQQTHIHWDLCVYDVIALGLTKAYPKAEMQQKVRSISEKFSIRALLDKPFSQLSGGEKTRVQLARCCIKESPIFLADEPIAALDPYYQIDIMEQIKALTPQQTCVVVIHHLSLAYKFCDEVILLKEGKIIASGETEIVINETNLAKAFAISSHIDKDIREIYNINKQ